MAKSANNTADTLKPKGRVELFVTRGIPKLSYSDPIPSRGIPLFREHAIDFSNCELLEEHDLQNIIVNTGKNTVLESLVEGTLHPIARMAVGDRGTIPSDSTIPKVPTADMTALYNEVYRADVEVRVFNPTAHEVLFIKTFAATAIPITAFSNQALPVLNEVALITSDIASFGPPQPPVAAPNTPPSHEAVFSIRTFKSVPFDAANEIALTIRYTIYIE